MPKINWTRVVLAAIAFAVIAFIVNNIGAIMSMNYYTDPANSALWSKVMMPGAGPPGMEFYAFSIGSIFVTGLIFAWAYALLKDSIPGAGRAKGLCYGFILFLLAGVSYTLSVYMLFAVPAALVFEWAVQSLFLYVIAGIVFEKLIK